MVRIEEQQDFVAHLVEVVGVLVLREFLRPRLNRRGTLLVA